jgi:hypothetical protein
VTDAEKSEYAECLRDAWSRKRGAVVLMVSPIDYLLISRLISEDIPLRIALRGVADCGGRISHTTPFVYCEGSIREAVRRWTSGM